MGVDATGNVGSNRVIARGAPKIPSAAIVQQLAASLRRPGMYQDSCTISRGPNQCQQDANLGWRR